MRFGIKNIFYFAFAARKFGFFLTYLYLCTLLEEISPKGGERIGKKQELKQYKRNGKKIRRTQWSESDQD